MGLRVSCWQVGLSRGFFECLHTKQCIKEHHIASPSFLVIDSPAFIPNKTLRGFFKEIEQTTNWKKQRLFWKLLPRDMCSSFWPEEGLQSVSPRGKRAIDVLQPVCLWWLRRPSLQVGGNPQHLLIPLLLNMNEQYEFIRTQGKKETETIKMFEKSIAHLRSFLDFNCCKVKAEKTFGLEVIIEGHAIPTYNLVLK